MPRYISRLLVSASGLVLVCCAYALCADAPKSEDGKADQLTGEIIVIESKSGSSVVIEQARIRTIAGQTFIGGSQFIDESPSNPKEINEIVGGRIWVSVSEISRIIEFDTKAKFTGSKEIPALLMRATALQRQLGARKSGSSEYQELNEQLQIVKKKLSEIASSSK